MQTRLILIFITLISALSCVDEVAQVRKLVFKGTVHDGNTGQPLPNINVELRLYSFDLESEMSATIVDTAVTDNIGNYFIKVVYDPNKVNMESFTIKTIEEYFAPCSGSLVIPSPFPPFPAEVDLTKSFERNFDLCQTGNVRLVALKSEPQGINTLFYSQVLKTEAYDNVYVGGSYLTETQEKVFKYFTPGVLSTNFKFTIKKESGLTSVTEQNITPEAGTTQTIEVEF